MSRKCWVSSCPDLIVPHECPAGHPKGDPVEVGSTPEPVAQWMRDAAHEFMGYLSTPERDDKLSLAIAKHVPTVQAGTGSPYVAQGAGELFHKWRRENGNVSPRSTTDICQFAEAYAANQQAEIARLTRELAEERDRSEAIIDIKAFVERAESAEQSNKQLREAIAYTIRTLDKTQENDNEKA